MKTENELLQHIYQDASMATFTLTKLLENLKEKDNKIKDATEDILKEYEQFAKTSKQLLQEQKIIPQEESMMAKMGASMGIKKEVINDNSDASMAEMLIQGISIGSLEMQKKIKSYEKKVDEETLKLAKSFLKFQENAIEKLKKYL